MLDHELLKEELICSACRTTRRSRRMRITKSSQYLDLKV